MEDLFNLVPWLKPLAEGLGLLLVFAQAVVLVTPTKKDDAFISGLLQKSFVAKAIAFVSAFAPVQKKEGKLKLSE